MAKVRQATAMDSYGLIGKADAALFLAESEAEALAEAHAEAVAATKLQAGARSRARAEARELAAAAAAAEERARHAEEHDARCDQGTSGSARPVRSPPRIVARRRSQGKAETDGYPDDGAAVSSNRGSGGGQVTHADQRI